MSHYDRGAAGEHACIKDLLTNRGFVWAIRAAGSHGVADVVAFGRAPRLDLTGPLAILDSAPHRRFMGIGVPKVALVGVRTGDYPRHSPAERKALVELAQQIGAEPWEWLRKGRGRGVQITFRRVEDD